MHNKTNPNNNFAYIGLLSEFPELPRTLPFHVIQTLRRIPSTLHQTSRCPSVRLLHQPVFVAFWFLIRHLVAAADDHVPCDESNRGKNDVIEKKTISERK